MRAALFALFSALFFSGLAYAQNGIIIDEIMYDPLQDDVYNEWVEIYNSGENSVPLENWTLCGKKILAGYVDRNGSAHMQESFVLIPGSYAVITDGGSGTEVYENFNVSADAMAAHVDSSAICSGLTNTGGKPIELAAASGDVIETITYDPALGAAGNGRTLERNASGWFESIAAGGTPGRENSVNVVLAPHESNEGALQENETVIEEPAENETAPQETAEVTEPESPSGTAKISILSAPESMRFGDYASVHASLFAGENGLSEARVVAYIFSPHWISKELSRDEETIRSTPYNSGVAVALHDIAGNSEARAVLPLFLKCNEENKFPEGNYVLRVRLYKNDGSWKTVTESDTEIFVGGENPLCEKEVIYVNASENCPREKNQSATVSEDGLLEFFFDVPETVFHDENFTAAIMLKNRGDSVIFVEVYSYIYDRAKLLSYGFDGEGWGKTWASNAVKIELSPGNAENASLLNMPKNTTIPGTHTYKIVVKEVGASKSFEEEIVLVNVEKRPAENKTAVAEELEEPPENRSISLSEKASGQAVAEEPESSFIGRLFIWLKNIF